MNISQKKTILYFIGILVVFVLAISMSFIVGRKTTKSPVISDSHPTITLTVTPTFFAPQPILNQSDFIISLGTQEKAFIKNSLDNTQSTPMLCSDLYNDAPYGPGNRYFFLREINNNPRSQNISTLDKLLLIEEAQKTVPHIIGAVQFCKVRDKLYIIYDRFNQVYIGVGEYSESDDYIGYDFKKLATVQTPLEKSYFNCEAISFIHDELYFYCYARDGVVNTAEVESHRFDQIYKMNINTGNATLIYMCSRTLVNTQENTDCRSY